VIESSNVFPNYYIRNTKKRIAPTADYFFPNPFESLEGVHKELITYQREDGVELSGHPLLAGRLRSWKRKKSFPWFYGLTRGNLKMPASAGQVTTPPHQFTSP
jgi:hypothetical protein